MQAELEIDIMGLEVQDLPSGTGGLNRPPSEADTMNAHSLDMLMKTLENVECGGDLSSRNDVLRQHQRKIQVIKYIRSK